MKKKIKILVAQPEPTNLNSPFYDLAKKRNLNMSFHPFLNIEGETVKNIRLKKINIPKYTALILTSRNAVNHYFRICDEMRITVPNSMKYFFELGKTGSAMISTVSANSSLNFAMDLSI